MGVAYYPGRRIALSDSPMHEAEGTQEERESERAPDDGTSGMQDLSRSHPGQHDGYPDRRANQHPHR